VTTVSRIRTRITATRPGTSGYGKCRAFMPRVSSSRALACDIIIPPDLSRCYLARPRGPRLASPTPPLPPSLPPSALSLWRVSMQPHLGKFRGSQSRFPPAECIYSRERERERRGSISARRESDKGGTKLGSREVEGVRQAFHLGRKGNGDSPRSAAVGSRLSIRLESAVTSRL